MFFIKKLLTAFLFPPGLFVSAAVISGIMLLKRSKKTALAFIFSGLALWFCCIYPVSDFFMCLLENKYPVPVSFDGDVVAVLSGGIREQVDFVSRTEFLKGESLERVAVAVLIARRTSLPVIVSGGAPFSGRAESEYMRDAMIELGVPAKKIATETSSRDTFENAAFVSKMISSGKYKKPIIVTSAYHMPRAALMFESAGVKDFIPVSVARRCGAC